ncbi:MAG: hypothetical protein ACKVJK_13695 [Methylophagaceae bacterium]|jgi:hypothetical protein|tara:strand:+ start:51 stop:455 length:405 start_codon:yes stop_codon:yes gene_type:complete
MKLQVRKLIESDWNFLPSWWEVYDQPPPQRDFLPENGLGGFMVCKEHDAIAAMFLYTTNSRTAIPAIVISDKDYKDNDRSDALQLLVDFTSSFAEDMGYKYSFAWATPGVLLDKYIESGFSVNNTPSHELIIKY